ncbi:hypothetical protein GGR51DRAFT_567703 [Nemania sp. FL0031]|nr:hypothetical protein GGR51DRAFT_567703 [Nemania sp. FL0031]
MTFHGRRPLTRYDPTEDSLDEDIRAEENLDEDITIEDFLGGVIQAYEGKNSEDNNTEDECYKSDADGSQENAAYDGYGNYMEDSPKTPATELPLSNPTPVPFQRFVRTALSGIVHGKKPSPLVASPAIRTASTLPSINSASSFQYWCLATPCAFVLYEGVVVSSLNAEQQALVDPPDLNHEYAGRDTPARPPSSNNIEPHEEKEEGWERQQVD